MDKKDIMYLVTALALVLVIALVIKPVVTGQPLNTGIAVASTTLEITTMYASSIITPVSTISSTSLPTTVLTPSPTWNPGAVQTVVFVDPSRYGISVNESGPRATRINATSLDTNMTIFATFSSSDGVSGISNIIYVPFPYWELEYTVEPVAALGDPGNFVITPTEGSGRYISGLQGSYSTVKPAFTLQVMDGDDPNRIVRTITPPGGIDANLWSGGSPEGGEYPTQTKGKYAEVAPTAIPTSVDPRPWKEKFYEGQRNYYFVVTAKGLDSYSMEIKVPTRYIGQY